MNRLKLLREDNALRQSDIANLLNISSVAYSYYENEKRDIPTNILKTLADYYKVSIDYILGKSDIRSPKEVDMNDVDIAFADGIKGLNNANKEIIKGAIEALLAKQEQDKKKKK